MTAGRRRRVAVMISGRGSNMKSLLSASRNADYAAEIVRVISNKPDAAGLAFAREAGVATTVINHKDYASREAFEAELQATLKRDAIEIVALAGFMRLMTESFIEHWQGRMLNIHPSLLPSFKGLHPHAQALAAGVKIAGCTVHYVTAEMDSGPIIAQAAVPVLGNDTEETLAERILAMEHVLYPQALDWVARGDVTFETANTAMLGTADAADRMMAPKR